MRKYKRISIYIYIYLFIYLFTYARAHVYILYVYRYFKMEDHLHTHTQNWITAHTDAQIVMGHLYTQALDWAGHLSTFNVTTFCMWGGVGHVSAFTHDAGPVFTRPGSTSCISAGAPVGRGGAAWGGTGHAFTNFLHVG